MNDNIYLSEQVLVFILLVFVVPVVIAFVSWRFNKRSHQNSDQFSEKLGRVNT